MTQSNVTVGVVGATGTVGRAATDLLWRRGFVRQRLASRRRPDLSGIAGNQKDVETVQVDIEDATALDRFCARCDVLLNCAGPSYRIVDRVARAAIANGCDYVDVSGDDPAYAALSREGQLALPERWRKERRLVLSAGMIAGFSNVLPQWLANLGAMTVTRLTAQLGGAQHFSSTAAGDLVLSLAATSSGDDSWYGETGAAWRFGKRKSRVLPTLENAHLPHFRGSVTVQPFLSADAIRLAKIMGLAEMDWYNVFAGEQLRAALSRLRGRALPSTKDLDDAVEGARQAADLDLAGRRPWYSMVFALSGFRASRPLIRTAVATCEDTYLLTAAVAAMAVEDVVNCKVPAGLHFADEVLGPDLISRIRDLVAPDGRPIVTVETFETAGLVPSLEDGAV
jgi:NAD(P)-dependent dehydrogenase (short-subunit alcohol dehydrogenase family)